MAAIQTSKKLKWIGIGFLCLIVLLTALLWKYVGTPLIRFVSEPESFRAWVDEYGIYSRLAFGAMVVFQIFVAVIPGEPFEIAAGYAFGAVEGTILCIISAAVGSTLVFALVRKFGMRLVSVFFTQEQIRSVHFLKSSRKRDFLFLIIYAIPGTPKDLLSYVAGLTDIKFGVWLLICSLCRIPSIITSTVGGSALGEQNFKFAILVFAVTLVISGLGLVAYGRIKKSHQERKTK